jgi:CubicO group peptidase (beta-lactamase class C family)
MGSSNKLSAELTERIQRVEAGTLSIPGDDNQPPLQLTLQNLMDMYKVPGMSVAVIDNFEIAWAKGYGVTEMGTSNPVTPHTIFQSGSVSKPVAAAGALFLVQQGKLSLDENVNNKLESWKVPENEFTQDQKVTLRRILSHSAGLTVHGFPGYDVDEPVPSVPQLLNGEPPANTDPVRVDIIPGTSWRYSGGGTVIAQQLMVDATGLPFPQLIREILFDKIGMDDSTFEQPLPPDRHSTASSGTQWDGTTVHGKWHTYPEMAAGGLWSTASDLAKFAIEIALSKKGLANRVLWQSTAQEMLSPQIELSSPFFFGKNEYHARMGLGFFLGDETRPDLFGHTGDDEGFEAMLIMDGASGQGAAIMTNSQFGSLLYNISADNIAQEYGWKNYVPDDRSGASATGILMAIAQSRGIQAALHQYQTLKDSNPSHLTPDENTLVMLGYLLLSDKRPDDALEALKLEVREHPDYWNGYDTLAEIYMELGEKQLAIQNYEKSIELNPDNQNGMERLKELKKTL